MDKSAFIIRPLCVATLSVLGGTTWAATGTQQAMIEEVVVTAQKREQNLNDIGISVTAFSGRQLDALGLNQPLDLADHTPNLQINNMLGNSVPNITVRGIGVSDYAANNNPAAGIYVDDVYLTSPVMASFQMFDVERVEVLKGPQGTLYGRNTTAGAVNFISKKPSESFDASVSVDYGRYDRLALEGAIGGQLTEQLNGRIAVVRVDQGEGHQTNTRDGSDVGRIDRLAWRAMLDWQPSEELSVLFNVHGGKDKSDAYLMELYTDSDGDPYRSYALEDPRQDVDSTGGVLTVNWDLNESMTLTSISAYEQLDRFYSEDRDASPLIMLDGAYANETEQWSQELRLTQDVSADLTVIWGAFYSRDEVDTYDDFYSTDLLLQLGLGPATNLGNYYRQETSSAALFSHAEWQFAETWKLTGGLRYTEEDREFADAYTFMRIAGQEVPLFPAVDTELDSSDVSGKLGIDYSGLDNTLLYASLSKGYKSGGFQGQLAFQPDLLRSFDEETLWAYEAGFKARLFDNSMQLNVAAFYYDYQDMQAYGNYDSPVGPLFGLTNVGDVDIFGGEAELIWRPLVGLDISLGLGLLDTDISSPRVSNVSEGNRLANAPELTANGQISYEFIVAGGYTLMPALDFNYQDEKYFDIYETPETLEGSFWLWNARLTLTTPDDRWQVSAWGKNLGDEDYRTNSQLSSVGYTDTYGMPRTYGVSLEYNWQ